MKSGRGAVSSIADIDSDGRNDLIVEAPGFTDLTVWAFDLVGKGPYGAVEWAQFA